MARSKIEWLARPGTIPESWSPISGCDPDDGYQSEACVNCYARRMSKRLAGRAGYPLDEPFRVTMHPDKLVDPLRWRKPRTVFTCSMGDLWHHDVPDGFIYRVFLRMAECNDHTFIVLTKRATRMRDWALENLPYIEQGWSLDHIWWGITAENQQRADERIPILFQIPAAVRFVSVEPMLGEIDLREYLYPVAQHMVTIGQGPNVVGAEIEPGRPALSWCIAGGESGPRARPTSPVWARSLQNQCEQANVPFFWKGNGEWIGVDQLDHIMAPGETYRDRDWPIPKEHVFDDGTICVRLGRQRTGHLLDGKEWHQWPTP